MADHLPFAPVLADHDAVIAVIVALITVVGWIANLISNKNQKTPPAANRPRPPARPRDERLQKEINIFMEETGKPGSRSNTGTRPPVAKPKQSADDMPTRSRACSPWPLPSWCRRDLPDVCCF